MNPRRIIFLDIDGVLNCRSYLLDVAAEMGNRLVLPSDWDASSHIDPMRVFRLNGLIERTGASIVVSSSWRCSMGIGELQVLLNGRGLRGELIDYTPRLWGHERHVEIKRWLGAQHIEPRFVILDDDREAGVGFDDRFVFVTDGLENRHVELAVRALGAP